MVIQNLIELWKYEIFKFQNKGGTCITNSLGFPVCTCSIDYAGLYCQG